MIKYCSIVWRKGEHENGCEDVKMSEAEVEHGFELYGALQKENMMRR